MIREIVGVDVASKELVAYREDGAWVTVPNQKREISGFLKDLPKGAIVALEATGGYGHLLAELACKKGFTVYMLQPGKVKHFCNSSPSRGKTDKLDARDIAEYVRTFETRLHPYTLLPKFEARLRKLCRTKEALADKLASLRLQLRSLGDKPQEIKKTLAGLEKRVVGLNADINTMLASAEDAKVLFKIPGVKANLIGAVLPALRTIKFKNKYALDSYAGIDLKPNESGKFKGKRRISHQGDPHLRRAVYMAGFAGTTSKVWKPYYQELIKQKKLAPIAAINALGRKILHTVFGVFRSQTEFELLTLDIKT